MSLIPVLDSCSDFQVMWTWSEVSGSMIEVGIHLMSCVTLRTYLLKCGFEVKC